MPKAHAIKWYRGRGSRAPHNQNLDTRLCDRKPLVLILYEMFCTWRNYANTQGNLVDVPLRTLVVKTLEFSLLNIDEARQEDKHPNNTRISEGLVIKFWFYCSKRHHHNYLLIQHLYTFYCVLYYYDYLKVLSLVIQNYNEATPYPWGFQWPKTLINIDCDNYLWMLQVQYGNVQ